MKKLFLCGCLLFLAECALAAGRWELQFFYDVEKSALLINDLKFTSPDRGIAVGSLVERGKVKPAELTTLDGGKTWSFVKSPEIGLSLFFLDKSVGWMVTPKSIWKTRNSGRSWTKLGSSPRNVERVYFRDEDRGWAIGFKKSAYETSDGGNRWKPLAVLNDLNTSGQYTSFLWIDFANPQTGVITGASVRPRRGESNEPAWMRPPQREWPSLSISLETRDGGKSWKYNTTSMFGRIRRVTLLPDGRGLMLIEFFHAFDWPSEVFEVDWLHGGSKRVFRAKDCAVTDIVALPNGCAYLAGVTQPVTSTARSPIPEKVRFFRSTSFSSWDEMAVDYRAVATHVILAALDQDHVWAATDTGMILHLVK